MAKKCVKIFQNKAIMPYSYMMFYARTSSGSRREPARYRSIFFAN